MDERTINLHLSLEEASIAWKGLRLMATYYEMEGTRPSYQRAQETAARLMQEINENSPRWVPGDES